MQNLIKRLTIGLSVLMLGLTFAVAAPALAQKSEVCRGIGIAAGDGSSNCEESGSVNVDSVIKTVVNILSFVVGVVAIIMIIIGGLKYITSTGDAGKITSAKNTILYAIIGLIIVVLAQVIVRFVVQRTTTG